MELTTVNEAVEAVTEYGSVWKVLAGELPNVDLKDKEGLSISWADSTFPFWNAVFLTEQLASEGSLRKRVQQAAAYMRARQQWGLVYICEEYLGSSAKESLSALMAEEGFDFALPVFGMAGEMLPVRAHKHPELKIERVTEEAHLQAYSDVNCAAYGFPLKWGRGHTGLGGSTLWRKNAHTYLGYEKNDPVSAASVVVHNDYLYLALVATRPDAQKKGFAEAMVRHVLQKAHEATGLKRTLLHATTDGFPVYRRIGYHQTAKFAAYRLTGSQRKSDEIEEINHSSLSST